MRYKPVQKPFILFSVLLTIIVLYTAGFVNKNSYLNQVNLNTLNTNQAKDLSEHLVTQVIDGDTIEIDTGERVRLIGIDASELSYEDRPSDCFSREAKLKLSTLVINKTVQLEKDLTDKDKYERLLRYVWADNLLVNEVLVLDGYAVANVFQPDTAYAQRLYRAQHFARIKKKGLWRKCRS